jgi:phenylacetate-CoA ligase
MPKIKPYTKRPSTPAEHKAFVRKWPVHARDVDSDPAWKSRDEVRAKQDELLKNQIELLDKYSPFYSECFKTHGIKPGDIKGIDDLESIPLTFKRDYMVDRGMRFVLTPPAPGLEWIPYEINYTTGTTTGLPSRFYNTTYDMFRESIQFIRGCAIGCIEPCDVVMNVFPFHFIPHLGYYKTLHYSATIGCTMCWGFTGSPYPGMEPPIHRSIQDVIDDIETKGVTLLSGIGSYIRRVIVEAEKQKKDYSAVRTVGALGEAVPKGMRDDMRRRLQNMGAGDICIGNGFGATELQTSLQECVEFGGNHVTDDYYYYLEVVDETTGKCVEDGKTGLLAITHLDRRGTTLLRYVLGDIVAITHEPCPHCGRLSPRLVTAVGSTYGTRTSELVKLKGTLINPESLRDAIANIRGVTEYQIVFTKEDEKDPHSMDKLQIKIGTPDRDQKEVEREVIEAARQAVEMRPDVIFVPPSEIFDPTATLKATRVVDLRPKE